MNKIGISKPSLSFKDLLSIYKTLISGWWGQGKQVKKFEKNIQSLTQSTNCITTNSCTSAIHLCLMDLPENSEVIIPAITFSATALPILYSKLKPVLADVDENTLNIDFNDVEKKITKNTKAIIVVHMGGIPADIEKLNKIKDKYNIRIIEDCAHALGSYYKKKHVGNFGDFGCFSFHAIKNISTGDGGAIIAKKSLKSLETKKNLGIDNITFKRDEKNYHQNYDIKEIGYKYYMNDISASLGISQLKRLKQMNTKRKSNHLMYIKELSNNKNISFLKKHKGSTSSNHLSIIKLNNKRQRDRLKSYLNTHKISTGIHYLPLNKYSVFEEYKNSTPVADKVSELILTLPNYPDLKQKEIKFICKKIKLFFNQKN